VSAVMLALSLVLHFLMRMSGNAGLSAASVTSVKCGPILEGELVSTETIEEAPVSSSDTWGAKRLAISVHG